MSLKKADRMYKKHKFISAYSIYRYAILRSRELAKSNGFIKQIRQKEREALIPLEMKVQKIVQEAIREIKSSTSLDLIYLCNSVFREIKFLPNTILIEKQTKLLKKEQNNKITEILEPIFKETLSTINNLDKRNQKNIAVQVGQKFLEDTSNFSFINTVRVFRDRISIIIQNLVIQVWRNRYSLLEKKAKDLQKRRKFNDAISKLESFLIDLSYEDINALKELENEVHKKIIQIKEKQQEVEKIDYYQEIIGKALKNYEIKQYHKAIKYMEEAIKQIKGENTEGTNIRLKNTGVLVKDIEFIFLCQDKIKERQINEMVKKAKDLFKLGEKNEAMSLLLEAQENHEKLSTLYINLENAMYKSSLHTIRNLINQINQTKRRLS